MRRTIAALGAVIFACAIMVSGAGAAARHTSTATPASGQDKTYLMTSMEGDLFEIIGGKLALKKSHTPAVDALAKRLIKDHTKSYEDVVKVARKLGVKVEKTPSPSEMWELLTVAKVSGSTFDQWYTSLEVYDHVQDIQETADEIKDGSNADVISDAKQDLPVLKMHLKLAKAALRAVK
jgi:putative membrane protein